MGVEVAHKAQSKTITIPEITITIRPLPNDILESQHENCGVKNLLLMMVLRHVHFKIKYKYVKYINRSISITRHTVPKALFNTLNLIIRYCTTLLNVFYSKIFSNCLTWFLINLIMTFLITIRRIPHSSLHRWFCLETIKRCLLCFQTEKTCWHLDRDSD